MSSLKKDLVSGILYMSMAKYAGVLISLVVAGILARCLPAEDFGVVAVATVMITFFGVFSDLGIAPAIVQYKELSKEHLNHIFSFTLWSAIVLSILFFASSNFLATYYHEPQLISITRWLSVNLFFATVNIVPNALLFKAKRFSFVAYRSLAVQVVGGTVAVVGALHGLGIYALLVNPILSSVGLFVASYACYPLKIRWSWGGEAVQKIFSFSAYQFFFNVVNYFTRNLDKLLIGRFMDMRQLGYYEKSYRLMMLPLQQITHVVSPVMHPLFSDFQHDFTKLSASYLKVVRFLALIGFPLSALCFFGAKEMVLLVFGPSWEASVPAFEILSLSIGFQIILSTSGSIFQAANATRMMFFSGLLSAVLTTAGVLIGIFVFHSIAAVSYFVVGTFVVNFITAYILMYRYTFHLPLLNFFSVMFAPLCLSLILSFLLWGLGLLLGNTSTNPGFLMGSLTLKSLLVGGLLGGYMQYSGYFDFVGRLKNRFNKNNNP